MNLIEMVLQASLAVQLVMLLLALMSVYVWILLFAKLWQIRSLYRASKRFKEKFNASKDLMSLFNTTLALNNATNKDKSPPLEKIFLDGFSEFIRQTKVTNNEISIAVKSIQSRMRQTHNQQMDIIEQRSSTLATIGSSAPYIGLFGTVLGIIHAFQGLSQVQHATLTLVAPGISEALVATAMGLFVAIPAVIGYNRLQTTTERLGNYFEDFVEAFLRLAERQLLATMNKREIHSEL